MGGRRRTAAPPPAPACYGMSPQAPAMHRPLLISGPPPALGALDKAVADAHAAALARPGTDAAARRTGRQAWLRGRGAGCAGPAASLAACLGRSMTARIAALAPPPS